MGNPMESPREIPYKCVWCDSPVAATFERHIDDHWDRYFWSCGWCGDSGDLWVRRPEPPTLTFRLVCTGMTVEPGPLDDKLWQLLKKELEETAPGDRALQGDLGKVVLHQVALGLRQAKEPPKQKVRERLEALLTGTPDLGVPIHQKALLEKTGEPLFSQEAALTDGALGSFWGRLLEGLLEEGHYSAFPRGKLLGLVWPLASIYGFFCDCSVENQKAREEALFSLLQQRWQTRGGTPAHGRLLLRRGTLNFTDLEAVCRDLLLAAYPHLAAAYPSEKRSPAKWEQMVRDQLERDPALGVAMWRTLLDTAAPCLGENRRVAEYLLPNLIQRAWLNTDDTAHLLPFLWALEEETFARQVFQSAYLKGLQLDLLRACHQLGKQDLGEHLLALMKAGPLPAEEWGIPLRVYKRGLRKGLARRRQPQNLPLPGTSGEAEDGRICYCLVQPEGLPKPYAYLTGALPVQDGDWVTVPLGPKNIPRRGQILSVEDCTAADAPWPPAQTKTILGPAEPPEEPNLPAAPSEPPVPAAPAPEERTSEDQPSEPLSESPAPPEQTLALPEPPEFPDAAPEGKASPPPDRIPSAEREKRKKRARKKVVGGLAAAAALVLLCSLNEKDGGSTVSSVPNVPYISSEASSSKSIQGPEPRPEPEPLEIPEETYIENPSLPYLGMSWEQVNETSQLGQAAHIQRETLEQEKANGQINRVGCTAYTWYAQDGAIIFRAFTWEGIVIHVEKQGGDAYWDGDTLLVETGPFPYASSGNALPAEDEEVYEEDEYGAHEYLSGKEFYEDHRDEFRNRDEAQQYFDDYS